MPHPSITALKLITALFLLAASALHAEQKRAFEVTALPLPAADNSAQPDLVLAGDGSLYLSWIEKFEKGHRLRFSRWHDSKDDSASHRAEPQWTPARTIARGDNWFVNWADTPHLVVFRDGTLWAHWLRKNGSAIYDYGVALVRSADQGRTWSAPVRIEPEGARLDYGFVSLWEQDAGVLGIAWLDSRQKNDSEASHGGHDEHGGGAMMLRAATFDAEGRRISEWALDGGTCDCCPTSVAMTADGAVLAYRGRTAEEVRDMQLVRFDGTDWSDPVTVHADNWTFGGCPVNGPAVAAAGKNVWVAWYTEGDGQPSVRIARSTDAGRHFLRPQRLAEGNTQLGRVAMAMDAHDVWLTWLIENKDGNAQQLMLARFDATTGSLLHQQTVAELSTRGHASGLPQIQVRGGDAWLVWTDSIEGKSQLRGVRVTGSSHRLAEDKAKNVDDRG